MDQITLHDAQLTTSNETQQTGQNLSSLCVAYI